MNNIVADHPVVRAMLKSLFLIPGNWALSEQELTLLYGVVSNDNLWDEGAVNAYKCRAERAAICRESKRQGYLCRCYYCDFERAELAAYLAYLDQIVNPNAVVPQPDPVVPQPDSGTESDTDWIGESGVETDIVSDSDDDRHFNDHLRPGVYGWVD
jgi:hypothetical protein